MNGVGAGKHGETAGSSSGECYVRLDRLQATLAGRQPASAPPTVWQVCFP